MRCIMSKYLSKIYRAPTDQRNVISVITKQKLKGLQKLGTKNGLLIGWLK